MKTTQKKLAMTEIEYEMMVFGFYGRWCESVTTNLRDYQAVLANSAVNRWFWMELSKSEAEFHYLTRFYAETDTVIVRDFQHLYNNCTYRLFSLRPMALLEEVKTKQVKGMLIFNSTQN